MQDIEDTGIAGQPVRLYATDGAGTRLPGAPLAEVTTDSLGLYSFSSFVHSLEPNTEYVIETTVPPALQPTLANVGGDENADSDGVPVPGDASAVAQLVTSPPFGGSDDTRDFGFVPTCNIGGVAWDDANGDGVRQAGEPRLDGVTVTLREVSVAGSVPGPDRTAQTDAQGRYNFNCFADSIEPGTPYDVTIDARSALPAYKETTANAGGNDALDSDGLFDEPTQRTAIRVSGPQFGVDSDNNDFGYIGIITLGDLVWIDEEQPGTPGHGEQQSNGNRPGF